MARDDALLFAAQRVSALFDRVGENLTSVLLTSVGMPNFDNICYVNAVLQALLHCQPFR